MEREVIFASDKTMRCEDALGKRRIRMFERFASDREFHAFRYWRQVNNGLQMLLQLRLGPAEGDRDPLSQNFCSRDCFDKKRDLFTAFFSDVSKVPIHTVL